MRNRRFYFTCALLNGALWSLAWPAIGGITPLVFIAWVPLLLAEERYANSDPAARPRNFMPYVFLAVALWNACTTWWLYCVSESFGTKLFTAIGPNIGNDLLMCIPWALMRAVRKQWGGRVARGSLVFFWIAFERFHMHWDLSWPWLTLGNVFAEHPMWVQWYEITGALGGSIWIWAANMASLRLMIQPVASDRSLAIISPRGTWVAAIIAVPIIASSIRYATFREEGVPTEVVVVQPDIDPYTEKFGGIDPLDQLDNMLAQADSAVTPTTALVVMPETALQEPYALGFESGQVALYGLWENDLGASKSVAHIRSFLAKHPGLTLITGMSSAYLYPTGAQLPVSARLLEGIDRGMEGYNAALMVRPDGSTEPYHKSKLVPGVEELPFEKWLGPISALALDMGGTTGSLGTQEEREVMTSGGLHLAPVICYESIYGDHVAAHVRNGATLLIIMTNDAWWSDSPAYRQHLAYGRLRAIETRRDVARSANTGISCFIDQRGDTHDTTTWWTPAVRRATLRARSDLTFFTRHGDYIGLGAEVGSVALILVLLIAAVVKRFTRG